MNYLLLALSTTATSGKALLCKALGVGTYSERKTVLLHFRSLLIAACCSLLFVVLLLMAEGKSGRTALIKWLPFAEGRFQ